MVSAKEKESRIFVYQAFQIIILLFLLTFFDGWLFLFDLAHFGENPIKLVDQKVQ